MNRENLLHLRLQELEGRLGTAIDAAELGWQVSRLLLLLLLLNLLNMYTLYSYIVNFMYLLTTERRIVLHTIHL